MDRHTGRGSRSDQAALILFACGHAVPRKKMRQPTLCACSRQLSYEGPLGSFSAPFRWGGE
jgi:hypothetical protein